MADPLIYPEYRQETTPPEYMEVPVPGDPYNRAVKFPRTTPPDEIHRALTEFRQQNAGEIQDERPGFLGRLATDAPQIGSTVAGMGTAISGAGSNPLAVGTASGLGNLAGYGVQRAYDYLKPPTTQVPMAGGGQYTLPVPPQSMSPLQAGKESVGVGALSGLAEKFIPKVGPAFAAASRFLGLPGKVMSKQWMAEKALYPDKASPETKEMLEIDQMVRGAGGPGLPISRMGGQEQGLIPKTMEAIAHGGGSRGLHRSLEGSHEALQRKGEDIKVSWGLPQANDIGKRLAGMMDESYDFNVRRVQNQAYDTIRMRIPQGQAFINADATLQQITAPNSRLGSHLTSELQTLVDAKPAAASLLQKLKVSQQQAAATAQGQPAQPALNHWLTFDEAVELRTSLYKLGKLEYGLPTEDKLAAQAAQAMGRQLSGTIRQGLATLNPKLAGIQARADKVITGIKDTFKNDEMEKFRVSLEADPYTALKELMKPENASRINKIRAYLEPHKARLGQSTMTSAWDDMQRWFSGELVQEATQNVIRPGGTMSGVINGANLAATVNKYNRDTISAIWGDNGAAFHQLRLLARGLEGTAEQPTGMGKIAIQLALPGAVVGGAAGAMSLASGDDNTTAALKAIGAGSAIVMTPQVFGAILTNPSLLKHFTTGVWEYRKLGVIPESLRAVIRQGEVQAARAAATSYGLPPFNRDTQTAQSFSQTGQLPQPPTNLPFRQPAPQLSQR